jgi:uncharacterized membrane protein
MALPLFARSALLGAATGSRSQLPSAALALTADPSATQPTGSSVGAHGARYVSKPTVRNGFGGARYRSAMARVFGTDWPGAVIEDVVAAGLAFVAVR